MTDFKKKRLFLTGTVAVLVIAIAAAVVFAVTASRKPIALTVGFFNVEPDVQQSLTAEITSYAPSAVIITFDSSKKLSELDTRKCSILITEKGAVTSQFEKKTRDIPSELSALLSRNLLAANMVADRFITLPLILDHAEIAYYRTWRNNAGLEVPQTYEELGSYFSAITEYAPYPAVVVGSSDRELLSFISSFALAQLGPERYGKMVSELRTSVDRNRALPASVTSILDMIKAMKGESLYANWLDSTTADLEFLMQNHQLGSVFMTLSEHRQIPAMYIRYYDSTYVPAKATEIGEQTTICPTVCAMSFFNDHGEDALLRHLMSDAVQERLSDATKLSPASSRSPCYDVQSDDIRFWAAALPGGPLPGIAEACCASSAQQDRLCARIREYLR